MLTMHMGVQVYASARETVELIAGAHAGDLESYVHQSVTRKGGGNKQCSDCLTGEAP